MKKNSFMTLTPGSATAAGRHQADAKNLDGPNVGANRRN
jgi:hypothetical protein